ncbi:MAG: hypothetical protein PHQ53_00135 [Candidatus Krumholzibacteria bacterium]|nr:hypothetical protein [Candidatus Krumholzibacteria bacterium]
MRGNSFRQARRERAAEVVRREVDDEIQVVSHPAVAARLLIGAPGDGAGAV